LSGSTNSQASTPYCNREAAEDSQPVAMPPGVGTGTPDSLALTNPLLCCIMPNVQDAMCILIHHTTESESGITLDQTLLGYYIYRFLGALVPHIPPRIGYAIFRLLGDFAYSSSATDRENVHDNLRHVLGTEADPAQIEEVARRVFRNQACNYYDLFRVASLRSEQIERLVTTHGWERVDRALSDGKGLIVVSAHFGNVDVVAQVFATRHYPVTVAAEHLQPEELYQYVVSLRASKGIRLIPADRFLRPLYRALRSNEIIGLAVDRNLTGTGTLTEFFGSPALLPDGPVRLALRTGAPLMPAFGLRRADGTFEAFLEAPLQLENTGDSSKDVRSGMAKVVAVLEEYIARYPEQWVMFQPVWKLPAHVAG